MHNPLIPTLLTTLLLFLPRPALLNPPSTTNHTSPLPLPLLPVPPSTPPFSLPTSYPHSLHPQYPTTDLLIRNTLAHYPLAIDGKNFLALDLVFTQDVVADYSAPLGVLRGLESVRVALEGSLGKVRTQHALSTIVVEIEGDRVGGELGARSLTYYTASHFGVGGGEGQVGLSVFLVFFFISITLYLISVLVGVLSFIFLLILL